MHRAEMSRPETGAVPSGSRGWSLVVGQDAAALPVHQERALCWKPPNSG